MLLRSPGRVERRCPRRWAVGVGGGLTALAVLAAGLSFHPRAASAEPEKTEAKKDTPKKDEAKKDAPKGDPFKDVLEKLRKDLKDNPEALKQVEDAIKDVQKPQTPDPDGKVVPRTLPPRPFLPAAPGWLNPGIPRLDPDKEIEMMQEMLQKQLEMLQKQLQGGGFPAPGAFPGGNFQGGGFVLGPDGFKPFPLGPGMGGRGRLGIRVERPNDVVASQLDLPNGQGLVCVDVPAESVAGKAGLKPNDILMEVAGKPVSSNMPEFLKALGEIKADTPVDIVVMRKGKKETIKGVKLPEAKAAPEFPALPSLPQGFPAPGGIQLPPLPGAPGAKADAVTGPGETTRVEQVNDAFTIFYSKDGVKVTIAGTKDAGVPKPESIEVDDNGKTTRAESIEKLPKEYQEMAKKAMKAVK